MTINEDLLDVLKDHSINRDNAICYFLSLYYGYKPTYIPREFKIKINTTKIVEEKDNNLHWNIPLFEGQETGFEWVDTEYIELFKERKSSTGRYKRECIKRMKDLFAKNPDIRKHEVIGATILYLSATDPNYIRKPHYFIQKGSGVTKIQDILDWIEVYRDKEEAESEERSVTRTLQ